MARLLLAALLLSAGRSQMGMEGMGMGSGRRMRDKEPLAVKADLPCIKCDICEIVSTELWREAKKQREAAPLTSVSARPGAAKKKVSTFSEKEVNEMVDGVCNRRKEIGEWLWYVDLVESQGPGGEGTAWRSLTKKERSSKENFLQVHRTQRGGDIRKWDRESATAKRSCDVLFDEDLGDVDEIVVPLWRGDLDEKGFKALMCKELSARCGKDRKPVNAKGREDFVFERQDKSLVETERMMENMKDQGMPMVMQSREDMMEELYEQMEAEGLSREEADAFMESVQGGSAAEEESVDKAVSAGTQEPDYDEDEGEGEL